MLNGFARILYLRRTQIILCAVLVFLFGFGLVQPAKANFLGDIGQGFLNAILGAVGLIYGVIFNILGMVTGVFLSVAVIIFNWVSSPGFISLSYTNAGLSQGAPNYNNFVGAGWELTRGLANIIFVVALIAIGIGTALRISGYQAKQALKNLILMALLVNFTPVITGLIIDASNIVMNFFINPNGSAMGQIIANKSLSVWGNISQLVGGGPWAPNGGPQAYAAAWASISLVFYNIIAMIIYLLFAGVFMLRYVALWILVILSPFAFAAYVLPATRGYFTQWWKTFIQWCIVGIIAGFFLYLSEHLYRATQNSAFLSKGMQEMSSAPGLAPIMNALLPSIVPIILLFIGLTAALAGAPQGAKGIIGAGQRGITTAGKTFGKIYAKKAWKGTKGAARRTRETISRIPPIRAGAEAWRIQRRLGKGVKESLGAATERAGAAIRQETGWRTKEAIKAAPGAIKAAPGKIVAGAKRYAKGEWAALMGKSVPHAREGLTKAVKDSVKAGWKAAIGPKKKRKLTKEQIAKGEVEEQGTEDLVAELLKRMGE